MLTREQCREAVRLFQRALRLPKSEADPKLHEDISTWWNGLERLGLTKNFDTDWPDPVKVLCYVSGGILQGCQSNFEAVEIIVRDQDNIDAGDPDPMAEYYDEARDEIDWDAAGLPYEVF